MKRQARDEKDYNIIVERRQMKKRHDRRGHDYGSGNWRAMLEKLHALLDNETEEDALVWLDDGMHFLVQETHEKQVAKRLGLWVCSLRQMLEALDFECLEEEHWKHTIYYHDCFLHRSPERMKHIQTHNMPRLSTEKDVEMPCIAYSSALKPLEVRLSLSDTHPTQSWEVTIAPSVLPCPTIDAADVFVYRTSSNAENAIFDESGQWSDHDVSSPLWWSQRSDFSSICTDDLSDMDTLSQISAYCM